MITAASVIIIICAPNFAIDTQKSIGYLYPFGTLCTFNSSVPYWGAFGVALPILNYLVPAFLSTLVTALLSFRLLHHSRLHQKHFGRLDARRVSSNFESNERSSNGGRSASKPLPVSLLSINLTQFRARLFQCSGT